MRLFCTQCNRNPRAINYHHPNGKTYYRKICEECLRKKKNLPPYKPLWSKNGYKKKMVCDHCGFKCIFQSQMTVYHIDGNLENCALHNLRTICLNCVEVVKRKNINWKRGDLIVDK
jgi:hypothetical protein